jgi:putative molybdopterin biosynthesis protein
MLQQWKFRSLKGNFALDLMTTAEVAVYLRLKERSVYEMASKRQIPCSRATGKLLFSRRMIDRWIEGRTVLPPEALAAPPRIYAGSSDPLLEWALRESGSGIAVLAGGSMDGLSRFGRGEACMAGIHLRDPDMQAYNIPFIRRELPNPDIVAIRFASREQGLVVASGNPLGIGGIDALRQIGIRVALRPEGSGSRLLLETVLADAEIALSETTIHPRIAQTQEDVADLVAGGEADCGLAISAAAALRGLDFVPLGIREDFDLVMRRRDYFEPPLQALFGFMRVEAFHRRAQVLGGYDVAQAGAVIFNG